MGLGVALTGFLTGFAERATDLIDERNKELRKEHQQKLDLHAATVAEEMKARKEQRAELRNRLTTLKSYGIGDTIKPGMLGSLITDDVKYKNILNLIENTRNKEDISNVIKQSYKFSSPNSLKYDNPTQYIDAVLGERAPISPTPLPTQTKTAFGLSSSIQKRMSEEYERSLKIAGYDSSKTTTVPTGSITGSPPIMSNLTETEIGKRFDRGIINVLQEKGIYKQNVGLGKSIIVDTETTPGSPRIEGSNNKEGGDTLKYATLEYIKNTLSSGLISNDQASYFADKINSYGEGKIANDLLNSNVSTSSIVDAINKRQKNIDKGYFNTGPRLPNVSDIQNLMVNIKDKNSALYAGQNKIDIDNFISANINPIQMYLQEQADKGKSNYRDYNDDEKKIIDDLFSKAGISNYTEYDILYKQFEAAGLFQ